MPYTVNQILSVGGVFALFEQAIAHQLQYPKIRLQTIDAKPVVLSRAGSKSRYQGEIMVTDGGPFGSNQYFGRIDKEGVFHATDSAKIPVFALLERLSSHPVETASEYGRLTGQCCFCSLGLKDARSTAVGYGPVCADHFGLPWGAA